MKAFQVDVKTRDPFRRHEAGITDPTNDPRILLIIGLAFTIGTIGVLVPLSAPFIVSSRVSGGSGRHRPHYSNGYFRCY